MKIDVVPLTERRVKIVEGRDPEKMNVAEMRLGFSQMSPFMQLHLTPRLNFSLSCAK